MVARLVGEIGISEVRLAARKSDQWPDKDYPLGARGYWAGTRHGQTYLGSTRQDAEREASREGGQISWTT